MLLSSRYDNDAAVVSCWSRCGIRGDDGDRADAYGGEETRPTTTTIVAANTRAVGVIIIIIDISIDILAVGDVQMSKSPL